jgi:ABC-2 type transport system ATP-binding protein
LSHCLKSASRIQCAPCFKVLDLRAEKLGTVDHGKMIAMGTPAELKTSIPGGYLVRVKFSAEAEGLADRLRELPGVNEVKVSGSGVDIYADRGGALVGAIVNAGAAAGLEVRDVNISEPSLENLFLHHTGRSLRQ